MDYQKLKEANEKFAFEQLKIDADKGHLFFQYQIALMYENGIGTDKNPEKAFEYYTKAANQGHTEAKIELEKFSSSKSESANPSSAQLTQPIQPIAVKRPFVLNMSESSAFSSAKKQAILQ